MNKLTLIVCSLFFTSFSTSQNCNDEIHTGNATFYGGVLGNGVGNCSLPVNDLMHCAMNNFDYDNGNACGTHIEVTGANGSVVLKVVDRCAECLPGDLDVTMEAFEQIANVADGISPVSWRYVPGNINETIKVNFKSGSDVTWTAIQLRGIKYEVLTLEYELPDSSWQLIDRDQYNFFVETSGISSPMNLRATPVIGSPLIFYNVLLDPSTNFDTGQQFATPSECLETLSVNGFEKDNVVSFPNPTSDKLYLNGDFNAWELMDATGKILIRGKEKQLDLSHFSNGLYFLKVNKSVLKVVKGN